MHPQNLKHLVNAGDPLQRCVVAVHGFGPEVFEGRLDFGDVAKNLGHLHIAGKENILLEIGNQQSNNLLDQVFSWFLSRFHDQIPSFLPMHSAATAQPG